ncbi:sphingosine kinase [Anaeramoeba flamelloides]|uniref:Sphingosine kinase n=1 Tax=Anaeramoeba flamelloides TaxID=1746091 RepID=A0ABQ8XF47_9EUKA|nr:sphingosine kinase [Anaeramoeba flamelloides]
MSQTVTSNWETTHLGVLINPASSGGKAKKLWPKISKALKKDFPKMSYYFTECVGDGMTKCKKLLGEGCDTILVISGDGVINEASNEIVKSQKKVALAVIPLGTGSDFSKVVYQGKQKELKIQDFVNVIKKGLTRMYDVGKTKYYPTKDMDYREERYFVNIASVGMSALISAKVNKSSKKLGFLSYSWSCFETSVAYNFPPFTWTAFDKEQIDFDEEAKKGKKKEQEEQEEQEQEKEKEKEKQKEETIKYSDQLGEPWRLQNRYRKSQPETQKCAFFAMGIGRYFGGGMKVCPNSIVDDGLLDCLVMPSAGLIGTAELLLKVRYGAHLKVKGTHYWRAKGIKFGLPDSIWKLSEKKRKKELENYRIELEGEAVGFLPAKFQVVKNILRVIVSDN